MQLSDFVGKGIMLFAPGLPNAVEHVKLLGVEAGGIWIESPNLCITLSQAADQEVPPHEARFFVPYGQIHFACVAGRDFAQSAPRTKPE